MYYNCYGLYGCEFNMIDNMAITFYKQWYKDDVKDKLSREDKIEIINQISEISLTQPLYLNNVKISHNLIPKLSKFSNTDNFTGLQLYTVMTEISYELFKRA